MKPHAVVIGHEVAGLVTAYRLLQQGYSVDILDFPDRSEGPATLPLVFHGPLVQTYALLHELGTFPCADLAPQVSLDFQTSSAPSASFRPALLPAPWHSLLGFLRYSGLSWESRWNFLNYLENIWEGRVSLQQDLHGQSAQDWLLTGKQDEEARRQFWNPLCLFLLNDHLEQTAAWPFIHALKQHFWKARANSNLRLSLPTLHDLLLQPLRTLIRQLGGQVLSLTSSPHILLNGERIQGLSLEGNHRLEADVYVSTVSPQPLTEMLPERILARLGFFLQLNQLRTVPALILEGRVPIASRKPRLLLTSGPFSWFICHPVTSDEGESLHTYVSCVGMADEDLFAAPEDVLETLGNQEFHRVFATHPLTSPPPITPLTITRLGHACITYAPGTMSFRPSPSTPIPNLFLGGYWTQGDSQSPLEADIQSAYHCVKAIIHAGLS